MIAHWPTGLRQKPQRGSWTGGPRDQRRSFQPDVGPPLMRPGSTADVMVYSGAVFPNLSPAMRLIWEEFWTVTLQRGSLPFSWRDPETDAPGLWCVAPGELGYSLASKGAGLSDLTLSLIRRPGAPWWGAYLRDGENRVPYAVADYAGSVFGVAGVRTAASAVAAVAGTYDVYTTATPSGVVTEQLAEAVLAGDIPATAPGGVAKIVAYLP